MSIGSSMGDFRVVGLFAVGGGVSDGDHLPLVAERLSGRGCKIREAFLAFVDGIGHEAKSDRWVPGL